MVEIKVEVEVEKIKNTSTNCIVGGKTEIGKMVFIFPEPIIFISPCDIYQVSGVLKREGQSLVVYVKRYKKIKDGFKSIVRQQITFEVPKMTFEGMEGYYHFDSLIKSK